MARVRLRRALDRAAARGGRTSPRPRNTSAASASGSRWPSSAARTRSTVRWKSACSPGLRLNEGLDLERIGARYDMTYGRSYGGALQPFVDAGLVVHSSGILRLTREGMLLANEVMAAFV